MLADPVSLENDRPDSQIDSSVDDKTRPSGSASASHASIKG